MPSSPSFRDLADRFPSTGNVTDALQGRRRCRRLRSLLEDPALESTEAERELAEIVHEITGRELSPRVVGRDENRVSLTDLFEEGAALARAAIAEADAGDAVLEYGGGLGQVADAVAPRVERLVSVDADPRVAAYGSALVPGAEFRHLDELPADETFDGAYAIGLFQRLAPEEWERALDDLRSHLAPGGWLVLNPAVPGPEFRALYEPFFRARASRVRDGSLVLEKRSNEAQPSPAPEGDRWAVDETSVVADVLNDEVVVVDLDSGAYYVLEGSASVIWQTVAAGQDVPAVVAMLSDWYPDQASEIATAVPDFIAQLANEGLLVPAAEEETGESSDPSELRIDAPFNAPEMFRYTEMEALIQMDPIREYDETGWPRRPAGRSRRS